MHKQRRDLQPRQMLHSQLRRLARRMQGIRQQQQSCHQVRLPGAQHRRLPPAVRMPAQENSSTAQFPQSRDCISEPVTIAFRVSRPRRTVGTRLSKWQIAAQHGKANPGECCRKGDQKGRAGVRSRAMRQHQPVAGAMFRTMQESANRRIGRRIAKSLEYSRMRENPTENCELKTSNWVLRIQPIEARAKPASPETVSDATSASSRSPCAAAWAAKFCALRRPSPGAGA